MAYTYCTECDAPLDEPSVEQCIQGYITCHYCSEPFHLLEELRTELILEMICDIAKIKQILSL